MKKLLFLSLLAFAATACNDDDGPEAPYYTGRTGPLVNTVTEIAGTHKTISTYTYDQDGRITRLVKVSQQDGTTTSTSDYTIIYNADRVVVNMEYSDPDDNQYNYTQRTDIQLNRQGRMTASTSEWTEVGTKIQSSQTAKYDNDNRLTSVFSETKVSRSGNKIDQINTIDASYTWADGKIVSGTQTNTTKFGDGSPSTVTAEISFTYSNTKNSTPLTFVADPIEQELGLLGDLSPYLLQKADTRITFSSTNTDTQTDELASRVDAQGRISGITITTDGSTRETWEFTYKN